MTPPYYMRTPLFRYSPMNAALVSDSIHSELGLHYGAMLEHNKAMSLCLQTPAYDYSIGLDYPQFATWGNDLLNPMLAAKQAMFRFQNNGWMNPANGGWWNNLPWNNSANWSPFSNNGGSNSSSTGSTELDALKALITKYKEIGTANNSISPSLLDKINNALNKSGTNEEKLNALKDIYKNLDKTKLEKALLDIPEYKIVLDQAGYNFNGMNKEEDKKLRTELNSLESDIKAGKGDKLVLIAESGDNKDILRVISYWNDTRNTDTNRGIIRLVAQHIRTSDDEKTPQMEGVKYLAMSLINKADEFKGELEGSFPNLDKAKDDVQKAMDKATGDVKNFTKANVEALAKAFDTLYATLRVMEAEHIRNTIQIKYKFLNDISTTDKDFVTDDLVVKSTKEDLKKEGISTTSIKTDNIPKENQETITDIGEDGETPEVQIEKLIEENYLEAVNGVEGLYKTKQTSDKEPPHFYAIVNDKLVELKGVKAIDANKKCTMIDGSTKTIEDAEKNTVEVTAQDIVDYNSTLKRIDELVSSGSLLVVNTSYSIPGGGKLYYSKGKKADGYYQYFVVRNNKLMRIDCLSVSKNGWFMFNKDNTGSKLFQHLKDENFVEVNTSEILTTDAKKEVKSNSETPGSAIVDISKSGSMIELADALNLEQTGVSGYYKKGKTYYKYNTETQQFEKLDGVTDITSDGKIVKKGSTTAARSVDKPGECGRNLRRGLYGGTDNYDAAKRELNTFSTYDSSEDIISFIEGYNSEKSPIIPFNDEMCSQISSENNLGWRYKSEQLTMIAKKILKVMEELNWDQSDSDYLDMKGYANKKVGATYDKDVQAWRDVAGFSRSWSFFSSKRTGAANHMDDIIAKVITKYREEHPKS